MQFDLVFEGGGAKGMAFIGALQGFEAAGHTHGRLLGTSAGAIIATLLAAGYGSAGLLEALTEEEDEQPVFAGFMGVPRPFEKGEVSGSATAELLKGINLPGVPGWLEARVDRKVAEALLTSKRRRLRHFSSFVERGGWYSAEKFVGWIRDKLDTGSFQGNPRRFGGMTLREFHQTTETELCLIASDTTGRQMLVLNYRTAPDCPVVWAVRMSMSIPLLWQEIRWKAQWGDYRDSPITDHVVVDGGVLSNFPMELLVSGLPHITDTMGAKKTRNFMGLLIDESVAVEGAPPRASKAPGFQWGGLRTVQRLSHLIDTMISAHDKDVIDDFESFVVRLPAAGFGTTEFHMEGKRREALIRAARAAMHHYLQENAELIDKGADSTEYQRAVETADRLATRILGLGMQAAKRREYDKALELFDKAIETDPTSSDAREAVGWLQQSLAKHDLEQKDREAARQRLRKARQAMRRIDAGNARSLAIHGYICQTLAQISKAEEDHAAWQSYLVEAAGLFQKAADQDPENPSAHNGLGNIQHELGRLDDAIASYQRAIGLHPSYAAAHHDLALAYEHKMAEGTGQAAIWHQRALSTWRKTYRLATEDPGFTWDKILWMGRRIRYLESHPSPTD